MPETEGEGAAETVSPALVTQLFAQLCPLAPAQATPHPGLWGEVTAIPHPHHCPLAQARGSSGDPGSGRPLVNWLRAGLALRREGAAAFDRRVLFFRSRNSAGGRTSTRCVWSTRTCPAAAAAACPPPTRTSERAAPGPWLGPALPAPPTGSPPRLPPPLQAALLTPLTLARRSRQGESPSVLLLLVPHGVGVGFSVGWA